MESSQVLSEDVLTFYAGPRLHYLCDPARAQAGRKEQLCGAEGGTSTSPAAWSQSGPTPHVDSSIHRAETPKRFKNKTINTKKTIFFKIYYTLRIPLTLHCRL